MSPSNLTGSLNRLARTEISAVLAADPLTQFFSQSAHIETPTPAHPRQRLFPKTDDTTVRQSQVASASREVFQPLEV